MLALVDLQQQEELERRRIQAPDPQPEPEREERAPMARLASDVGNQAFASTLGRSPLAREAEQGAGIMPDGTVHSDVQSTIDATRGAGTALDNGVADRLSSSLGDLSDVRVHTDDTADQLNRSVSARAFATGTDVYFAERRVQPGLGVRRQADRARARARRPAARRQLERPAHRVAARRRDGARGRLRRRSDPLTRMADSPISVGFDFIDRRVMAAVERVASSDPNPADPFRGLYISDDRALELTRGDSVSDADDRLAQVTAALGLDLLDAAVLAICAAPELNPRYGRLYAYLQDDVTRKLPSPRLVGHLLAGEGVSAADVMMAFERDAPLRAKGAIRLQGDAQTPLAERPIKLSDRLAAHLLGVGMDDPPAGGKLRMVPHPGHDPGRDEAVAALAATLAHPSSLPVVLAGPDAEALVAKAYGRALVVAHIREIDVPDTMAEAALIEALEDRPLVFEGLEDVEPGERPRLLRAIERRGRADRRLRADPQRGARARRPHLAADRGRAAELRRAPARLGAGVRRVRRTRRRGEVPALDRPDPRGRRGRPARGLRPRRRGRRSRPSSTSARARRPPPGSASWRRGSRPATPGTTSSCPTASASCWARSARTCATATACCRSGATRRPSPAPRD